MSLKKNLKSDLAIFFTDDEFAEEVEYNLGTDSYPVTVQFFDEESALGDTMLRKVIAKFDEIQNISKDGYFRINGDKYGVISFMPDEQKLIQQIILRKETK